MKRKLDLLDRSTGETFDAPIYLHQAPHKQRSIYGDRWMQLNQDPLLALSQDRELWGLPQAVLLYLCGKLDFENYVFIAQKDIAKHLQVAETRISEAVKKLCQKGILIKGPRVGRSSTFRLNPAYGWKGDNKKAYEYQLELIKGGRP